MALVKNSSFAKKYRNGLKWIDSWNHFSEHARKPLYYVLSLVKSICQFNIPLYPINNCS